MRNRRTSSPTRGALRLSVFVQNQTQRKGVPLARSFETWIKAALTEHRKGRTEVNIVIVDEVAGRELNSAFRQKNYATNVLSFPYDPLPHERTALLGDVVFCAPVVAREAAEQSKSSRDHFAHLTVHGVLHLLGYDHESATDAEQMETLERQILAKLRVADPY